MTTKKVTLIGGKFHRHKIEIPSNDWEVKMPISPSLGMFSLNKNIPMSDYIDLANIEIEEYAHSDCILGEFGIFPDNVFLYKKTNILEFLRNLVLDYVR